MMTSQSVMECGISGEAGLGLLEKKFAEKAFKLSAVSLLVGANSRLSRAKDESEG